MEQRICNTCAIVREADKDLLLAETHYWQIFLSNQQNYPGRCFIPLKRHASTIGELRLEEWDELKTLIAVLEPLLCSKLGASNVNFSCLMNGAYGSKKNLPHVHFHAVPRYPHPVEFGGSEFIDERYGFHYTTEYDWVLGEEGSKEIKSLLTTALQESLAKAGILAANINQRA